MARLPGHQSWPPKWWPWGNSQHRRNSNEWRRAYGVQQMYPIQMLRRYWNHCKKPNTSYPTATASAGTWIHWVDLKKNVWSKLRWIQSTGIKGVKDVFFEDAAPIKTHECCTSSRTHGHGTVAKLLQLLHHVYSLQIHGYGFDCVCLKMVHTLTWQFVYWKIGDYPLSAVFLEGVPVFQTNPYAVTKKRKYLESYTNPQKILVECMGQNMFGIRFEVRIS